mmetsp:Transcript_70943/g.129852  ORF Transcript_70943/g.129852 Transcript_70943/m.129852 type:complete len:212 (+) Transcript_70943:170-805(+)
MEQFTTASGADCRLSASQNSHAAFATQGDAAALLRLPCHHVRGCCPLHNMLRPMGAILGLRCPGFGGAGPPRPLRCRRRADGSQWLNLRIPQSKATTTSTSWLASMPGLGRSATVADGLAGSRSFSSGFFCTPGRLGLGGDLAQPCFLVQAHVATASIAHHLIHSPQDSLEVSIHDLNVGHGIAELLRQMLDLLLHFLQSEVQCGVLLHNG